MVGGPKPEGYGTKKAEGVPGHACAVPVGAGAFGGARGCIQRPKVSTIVMRPPQHGHGRRGSAGGAGSTVKSFGRWQAYESPRRTNPRECGCELWGFADRAQVALAGKTVGGSLGAVIRRVSQGRPMVREGPWRC